MLALLLLPGGVGAGRCRGDSPAPLNDLKTVSEMIRRMDEHGETAALERQLTAWQRRDPREFRTGDYDYLLARILERHGRLNEAATLYRQVADRGSLLAGHALRRAAALARQAGSTTGEQRLLERLLASHPQFIDREAVVARLSDSLHGAGRDEAALDVLRRYGTPRRDNLVRVAEAQAGAGWKESARETFAAVLNGSATDEISLRAARGLDQLDAERAPNLSVWSEAVRLQRARLYQFNRCFDEARRHWRALLRDFPATAARPEALFQLGRGYYLENNFRAAREWYHRVATEYPDSDEGEQGFYYLGHCEQGLAETGRAIEQYELFLRQYPQSRFVGYEHLNAIDTLRSAGKATAALDWVRRLRGRVTEPFFQVAGLFSQARINLAREDYAAALADLLRLRALNLASPGLTATANPAEVDYWRGYCLEKLGRPEEALEVYLALPEVRSGAAGYYGRRATIRLRALAPHPASRRRLLSFLTTARQAQSRQEPGVAKTAAAQALRFPLAPAATREMTAVLGWSYGRLRGYQLPPLPVTNLPQPESPRLRLATRLLGLGLADEAGPELAAADLPLATLAWYCARSECAHLTLRYSEPLLNALPADYRPEMLPREWRRLLYPTPWREELERLAVAEGIDPLLLLAIARQESRFQPRAASAAAARGILQFIVPTALTMAAEVGRPAFTPEDLFSPIVSLQLGARYVRRLKTEFTTPEMIAAAYNGSEESVRRWIERSASREVERHVSEILKRETKAYVYSVDSHYQAYRMTSQSVSPSGR